MTSPVYNTHNYERLDSLVAPEVTLGFLQLFMSAMSRTGQSPVIDPSPAMTKRVIEVYAYHYKPMLTFLWGLTPAIRLRTGLDLLPSYAYMRVYQRGDVLKVHADRDACEHSVSLTLAYSDGFEWPLEIGTESLTAPQPLQDDFGGAPYASISMKPGDALLYRGVTQAHGRLTPNPNRWSAHMFLHWVDRVGPHADKAFDGVKLEDKVDFPF